MSSKLSKLLRRPRADWGLLMQAWLALTGMRVMLCCISFDRLHNGLVRRAGRGRLPQSDLNAARRRVKWATHWASRLTVGKVTCLPLALTGLYLLRREGCPAHLRLGVHRAERGSITAHAWVECGPEVVVGGLGNLGNFHRLPRIRTRRSRRTGDALPGCSTEPR